MEQIVENETYIGEINVDNMQFRVISNKPQHSKENEIKAREEMRKELYQIFRKYK